MHVNVNLRLKILVERHRLTSNSFQYSIYNQKISDLFADNLQQKVQINTTYTIKCCGLLFVLCFLPVFSFLVVEFHPLSAARFSSEYRLLELKHTTLKSVRKVNSYTILDYNYNQYNVPPYPMDTFKYFFTKYIPKKFCLRSPL